jgi:hypothetical protein
MCLYCTSFDAKYAIFVILTSRFASDTVILIILSRNLLFYFSLLHLLSRLPASAVFITRSPRITMSQDEHLLAFAIFRTHVWSTHWWMIRLLSCHRSSNSCCRFHNSGVLNPLTPELNPSAQRCLTRFFTGDFSSWTLYFDNICMKNQQMQQLFIQFINYVW